MSFRSQQPDTRLRVRPPAIAGTFYPAAPGALNALLDRCWDRRVVGTWAPPKAVIAPHAGLVYSGPIAATAYAAFQAIADRVRRVVLLGPSHHFGFAGFAVPAATAWRTPLGDVPLDVAALTQLGARHDVVTSDKVHGPEHSLEVHVPFMQRVFSDFSLVPVAVGRVDSDTCADVVESLWGGDETVVVISSDLSHFFDQATARRTDAATTRVIEALDGDAVLNADACGRYPISGLLKAARRRGMTMATADVRTSADTAGDASRVVGYGSYFFWEQRHG